MVMLSLMLHCLLETENSGSVFVTGPHYVNHKVACVINVHLICKFQEELVKTEQVMMITKSNGGFFSNQRLVTLRLMIQSRQFSSSSESSYMST